MCQNLEHVKNCCAQFSTLVSTAGLENRESNGGDGAVEGNSSDEVVFAFGYHITIDTPSFPAGLDDSVCRDSLEGEYWDAG